MSSSPSPPRGAGGAVPREASPPPRRQQPPPPPPLPPAAPPASSSSFSAAAFQPPWALEAGRGSLSAAELAVVALGRAFFFCYALLRFLLVSLNVLPGPGGRGLSPSVARLGGLPPRMQAAREAAERVAARVLNRPLPQRPAVILCFGDSLTEGTLGADWVSRLGDSLRGSFRGGGGVVAVNAGVSGQLAAAVASRVEACVAACSGRVVGVFVMAGTNDVLAACAGRAGRKKRRGTRSGSGGGNEKKKKKKSRAASLLDSLFPEAARRSLVGSLVRFTYRATNALPRAPLTRPAALAAVAAALDAAALAAPGAALAVATIPPLGSGGAGAASSRANAAVRDLNRGIRCVASARPRVTLLDVHAALSAAFLASAREEGGGAGPSLADAGREEEEEDDDEDESEDEEDVSLSVGPSCLASVLLRVAFRISWDRAAQWKAFPAAAAAAATSLPQRLLSSSLLSWARRSRAPASASASASASAARRRRRAALSSSFSSSSNSLLHDGVHFGETAAACVLALTLPWARRAARSRIGSSSSSSSSSSAAVAGALRGDGGGSGTGLATALSLASSPPSPSRRRGAVVAASTSRSVAVSVPSRDSGGSSSNGTSGGGGGKGGGGGGVSGALASAAIRLLASSR